MTSSPRVLIADDHPPTRTGVRLALERGGIEVCAEAANASDAVEAALRERPDACILDVNMPGGGTSAASMISSRLPETVVLMLTVSSDVGHLLESLRRGAAGYLLKDMDPLVLPVVVRLALKGEAQVPRALVGGLVEEVRHGTPRLSLGGRGRPELTKRESEVLELLRDGGSTADIAKRLFLSQVTVRRHVSAIIEKLGVSSREEAIAVASANASMEADVTQDSRE